MDSILSLVHSQQRRSHIYRRYQVGLSRYVLFMNTSKIITGTPRLDSIESNLLDNHNLLHFNNPTTESVLLLVHGQQRKIYIHRRYQVELSRYLLFMNTNKVITGTPHLASIESNLLDNHKLLDFNNATTDSILLLVHGQQRRSHIHSREPGRIIQVCTVHEYKQNYNWDPSSRLHTNQPTGQPQVTPLQQSYYGYYSITCTRLVEEKSHPQAVPGRLTQVCTVHEYKQNYNRKPISRLHRNQPTGQP